MCPLSTCAPGEKVVIQRIAGGWGVKRRMADMGFYPGERLVVVNSSGGPVIVDVKGTRVGIGRNMANKIFVTIER